MVTNILVGILAIVIGALFCFRGVIAMRVVIAIWGAFVGFNLGAAIVSAVTGDGYLSNALGWVVGVCVAFLFGLLAYLYYAVAVVVAMASIGFALGTALMVALGVTWNWVIVLVGVVIGVLLAVAAVAANLPAILLLVLSAFGGATAVVGGIMLVFHVIDTGDFTRGSVTSVIHGSWWWYIVYVVVAIAGIAAQARVLSDNRDLQQQW